LAYWIFKKAGVTLLVMVMRCEHLTKRSESFAHILISVFSIHLLELEVFLELAMLIFSPSFGSLQVIRGNSVVLIEALEHIDTQVVPGNR
jgi:hypothetical protein